ncbi:MAG: hypothetical protein QGI70_16345, partial [Paracoccaceae bacterium]|nr:hypothetical protein [Paracoccaceae bacterium]
EDIPFSFRPGERLFERLGKGAKPRSEDLDDGSEAASETAPQPEPEILTAAFSDQVEEQGLVLDEEMLRGMVHDIVRQELQGVLGERITRNVRKLVRREIQRAFSEIGQ